MTSFLVTRLTPDNKLHYTTSQGDVAGDMADIDPVTSIIIQIKISNRESSKASIRGDVLCEFIAVYRDGDVIERPADIRRLHKRLGIQDGQIESNRIANSAIKKGSRVNQSWGSCDSV